MKTVDFSESVLTSDLKVGRRRQLIEFMKLYEKPESRSFLDLDPRYMKNETCSSQKPLYHFQRFLCKHLGTRK